MGVEELNNNLLSDLNTTFDESLDSGFYGISWSEYEGRKRLLCMTKDGQYSFYFALENGKIEMLGKRKEVDESYTLDKLVDELQGFFSYKHNYFPINDYKNKDFIKENLEDIGELESYFVNLEQKYTKANITKILNDE